MKKAFFLVLLVPILTIGLISCDASIRSNIADLMGGFSGNVYVEAGLVEPNSDDVEAAKQEVVAIGTSSGSVASATVTDSSGTKSITTSALGISVNITLAATDPLASETEVVTLKPQTAAKQTEIKTNLSNAIASTSQKEELLTSLKTTATAEQKLAAQGTVAVFNAAITSLSGSITDPDLKAAVNDLALPSIGASDEVTQADMLILQLMTDLVGNTIAAVTASDGSTINDSLITEDKALEIFGDALFTAKIAEELSGAATINFSSDLIEGLLGAVPDGSSSSRTTESGVWQDVDDSIGLATVNNLAPKIIAMFGVTGSGTNHEYTDAAYRRFIRNQYAYLASLNQAIGFYEKGNLSGLDEQRVNVGTIVKYVIAFLVTTIDDYHQNYGTYNSGAAAPYTSMALAYQAFLNDNPNLSSGDLSLSSPDPYQRVFDALFGGMDTYLATQGMQDKLELLVDRITILVEISGVEYEELDGILEDLPDTIENWFAEDTE